jgi:hypothetical protein
VCYTTPPTASPLVKIVLLLKPSQLHVVTGLSQISPGFYTSPFYVCLCGCRLIYCQFLCRQTHSVNGSDDNTGITIYTRRAVTVLLSWRPFFKIIYCLVPFFFLWIHRSVFFVVCYLTFLTITHFCSFLQCSSVTRQQTLSWTVSGQQFSASLLLNHDKRIYIKYDKQNCIIMWGILYCGNSYRLLRLMVHKRQYFNVYEWL